MTSGTITSREVFSEDHQVLEMTVEEGIKMVVSTGIVTPPERHPAEGQKVLQAQVRTRETAE